MGKIEKFEDLIAWQKARELTREIYEISRKEAFHMDFGLRAQIQRAGVSIMANLAEGFERAKRGEFHQFICIAKSSCEELRSHLYVALDAGYLEKDQFVQTMAKAKELSLILGRLRTSVARERNKPSSQS